MSPVTITIKKPINAGDINLKKLLLPILAIATSGLHAGLDSWISSIVPEKMRASEAMRSSIYKATDHLKIKKPVIVMHETLEHPTLAKAENNLFFSVIKVDNDAIARQTDARQKYVAYHECGHVLHNHLRTDRTAEQISTPAYILGALTSWYGLVQRNRLAPLHKYGLLATSSLSFLGSFIADNHTPDDTDQTFQRYEREADAVAYSVTAALDGKAPLEEELATNQAIAPSVGLHFRNRTERHPTIGEEIEMIKTALDKQQRNI
jgi:hypothetical protein